MKALPILIVCSLGLAVRCVAESEDAPDAVFASVHLDKAVAVEAARDKTYFLKVVMDGRPARGIVAFELSTKAETVDIREPEAMQAKVVEFVVSRPGSSLQRNVPLYELWEVLDFCDANELLQLSAVPPQRSIRTLPALDPALISVYLKTPQGANQFHRGDDFSAATNLVGILERMEAGKSPRTVIVDEGK